MTYNVALPATVPKNKDKVNGLWCEGIETNRRGHYICSMQKIYFNHKPLFICSTITPEIDEYLHQGTTIFIDEFNKHTVETIIEEMQRPEINAGVFLHGNEEEVLDAIKQNLTLVQAAGGLVQVNGEQFLLIYRRGKWDLPKGKLDEGEDLKTCAVREVEEETGIKNVNLQDLLSITYHTYYENGLFILKETHWFLMSVDQVQPFIPQINEDIEKCEWVKTDGLAPYMENTHPSGKSSLQVVEVLKASGLEIIGMVSIFNYRFDVATEAFEKANVTLYSLTDYPTLLESAKSKGIVAENQQEVLLKWRQDPANWKGVN